MRTILAAVDFSEASRIAVSYAAFIANTFNADLLVVHAITSQPGSGKIQSDFDLSFYQDQMDNLVRKYTVKIRGIIRNGRPLDVIKNVAAEEKASLVVIGRKGKGESTSVFGSTAVELIGKIDMPILVVPEKTVYRAPESILVTIDLKDYLPVTRFKVLNSLLETFNPFVHVLNIQRKKEKLTPELIAAKSLSDNEWKRFQYQYHIVRSEKVEDTILDFLEENPADMLAMVAKRKSLFAKIFTGSSTRKMTLLTGIPLLVMRPEKKN